MARELAILVTARNMASGVLRDVRGDIRGIQSEARRGLQNTARNLTFIGGAAAVGLSALAVKSVKDASQLEQAMGAVDSVFGDAQQTLHDFAATAAQTAGLSRREVLEMGAVVGAQLQGMGFAEDEAAAKTVELEKRAADLAATFGGTTGDAVRSISALLRGERDPIEKYGVSLKQADINAEMAARGLGKLEGQEKKLAEAQVALDLLMRITNKTQGQFARESDSAAGAQARLTANLENTRATIGNALLPQVAKLTDRLNDAITDHMPEIEAFAAELPGVFDDLLQIVEALPWGSIAETMKLMGQGAKAALDLFTKMPPWVQTAVLTGWGLNKLSGGALGNIAGMLGKSAFGALRGSTPANPVFTKEVGVGGGAGAAGGGGKGAGIWGILGAVGVAAGAEAAEPVVTQSAIDLHDVIFPDGNPFSGFSLNDLDWPFGNKNAPDWASFGPPQTGSGEVPTRDEGAVTAAERAAINARDAIPWAQRNLQAIQNLNASEGRRFGSTLGTLQSIANKRTTFDPKITVQANLHNTVVVSGQQTIYRLNSVRQSLNAGTTVDGFI